MKWITGKNPIQHINTGEVKLSLSEVLDAVDYGFKYANRQDNPCATIIRLSVNKAIKEAFSKPRISR